MRQDQTGAAGRRGQQDRTCAAKMRAEKMRGRARKPKSNKTKWEEMKKLLKKREEHLLKLEQRKCDGGFIKGNKAIDKEKYLKK